MHNSSEVFRILAEAGVTSIAKNFWPKLKSNVKNRGEVTSIKHPMHMKRGNEQVVERFISDFCSTDEFSPRERSMHYGSANEEGSCLV